MKELEKIIEDIQVEMKKTLAPLDLLEGELGSIGGALTKIRTLLTTLRDLIAGYQFKDIAEEIHFFKEIKPVFLSQYIFHQDVFDIRLRCSTLITSDKQSCLNRSLRKCNAYIARHQEFYRYCLSNATHLDAQYFTRGGQAPAAIDRDPAFSTSYDHILSRLVAAQLLATFITQWIVAVDKEPTSITSRLKWTASKTDLTELIYALQAAEVFNNGSADIKQIATAFESMTGTNLGDYYRTFQAIQVRKNNQLVFITRLKDRLQARLDDIE